MCEHNCGIDHSTEAVPEFSLYSNISLDKSDCFNQSATNPLKNCIKPYNERHNDKYLESDADKELLIKIIFNDPVDINGIKILSKDEHCPRKLMFYVKNTDLNFDDVDDVDGGGIASDYDIILENSVSDFADIDFADIVYPLPTHKFSNIKSIMIFIKYNLAEDDDILTRIHYLDFNGMINKSNIDNGIVNCVYESSPQISDHKQISDLMTANHIN